MLVNSLPRHVVATHEAGHVLVALAHGARVDRVTIEPEGRSAGGVAGQMHFDDAGLLPMQIAAIWLGGRAAQMRVWDNDLGCSADLAYVRELPAVSFSAASAEADRLVGEHWNAIDRLAQALLARGGGSILPGGTGGTDSQLVAFRKSPNERVDILTPAQQRAGVTIINNVDARGATDPNAVAAAIQRAVVAAVNISDARVSTRLGLMSRPKIA